MKLKEFIQLDEGLKHFKLSDKLEKLVEKLQDKKFIRSDPDDMNALDKALLALKEIIVGVKEVEKDFANGKIGKGVAVSRLKRFKGKATAVKRYLQQKKVLNKTDWKFLVSTGLSLVWIPLAIWRAKDLYTLLTGKLI
jgi:hypothetical protein